MMDFRNKRVVPEWYEKALNLSTENKYKAAQENYFRNHPNDSISDFHLAEIEFWENRLRDRNKYPINTKDFDDWDIKFVVEGKKLLAYYQKLEQAKSKDESKLTLEQIFENTKNGYTICLELFKELQIIDNITGKKKITKGKGYLLFALIAAIKKSDHNLLNNIYTDNELLQIFNAYLQTSFVQLKRNAASFVDTEKKALKFINEKIKVAPAT